MSSLIYCFDWLLSDLSLKGWPFNNFVLLYHSLLFYYLVPWNNYLLGFVTFIIRNFVHWVSFKYSLNLQHLDLHISLLLGFHHHFSAYCLRCHPSIFLNSVVSHRPKLKNPHRQIISRGFEIYILSSWHYRWGHQKLKSNCLHVICI